MKIVFILLMLFISNEVFASDVSFKCISEPSVFFSGVKMHLEVTTNNDSVLVLRSKYKEPDNIIKLLPHSKHVYSSTFQSPMNFESHFRIINPDLSLIQINK
jgi:hypothetical protein